MMVVVLVELSIQSCAHTHTLLDSVVKVMSLTSFQTAVMLAMENFGRRRQVSLKGEAMNRTTIDIQ